MGAATAITIGAGGSPPVLNELVIASVGVLSPPAGLVVTPPTSTNSWNLISTVSPSANYTQYIFWHAISAAETVGPPAFTFSFTVTAIPTAVKATGVAILYINTCTQTTSPSACFSNAGSPIKGLPGTGTAVASNSVTESAGINIQANGIGLCDFGTSNTSDGIGPVSGGTIVPSGLSFNNGNAGENAGLIIYDEFGLVAGLQGPWTGTLPGVLTADNAAQCLSIIPIGF